MKLSKEFLAFIIMVAATVGCPNPVHLPTDTADCKAACDHLLVIPVSKGSEKKGCPEGQPLPNGTTCQQFCEDTQNSAHALRPSCIVKAETCEAARKDCDM